MGGGVSQEGPETISGSERAAIFLMALGESGAAEVLRHLGPREVQRVGESMAALSNVSSEQVEHVIGEFVGSIQTQTALGIDSDQFIRNVLTSALGWQRARRLIDRILQGRASKGLDQLKWMDAKAVAELLKSEHPQIVAIVLSYLESDHAAGVLAQFPEKLRADVVLRIATMEGINPAALEELDAMLDRLFAESATVESSALGGVKTAANILNMVDATIESSVMETVKETDEDIGQQIQDTMFVFENLVELDDRSIQSLLREVTTDALLVALKGSDEALKEKIFTNMSKRAAEMMRDDLEAKGPVRLSEVESAQKEILAVARRMSDAGEIILGGGGGDEFV